MARESDRVRDAKAKGAEIEEGHRGRGDHEKADKSAEQTREVVKGIKKEEDN